MHETPPLVTLPCMASVVHKGTNRWQLRAHIGNTPTGQPIHKSKTVTVHSKKHAEMLATQWELELRSTGYVGVGNAPTIDDVAARWLDRIDADAELEEWTRYGYRKTYTRDIAPRIGGRRIAAVTVRELDDFYRDLATVAPSAPRYAHVVLRAIWKEAVRLGVVSSSPLGLVSLPKRRVAPKDWPTMGDVGRVIEAAWAKEPWRGRFVIVAVGTGARRGELTSMRWSDVASGTWLIDKAVAAVPGHRMRVKDPKTHQRRPVPLHPDVARSLSEQREWLEVRASDAGVRLVDDPYLWCGLADGSAPFKPDWLSHVVRIAAKEAGVSATLHDMRHAFASVLVNSGEAITNVQRLLGHQSSVTTLSVYAHGDTRQQQQAIARLRLPQLESGTP